MPKVPWRLATRIPSLHASQVGDHGPRNAVIALSDSDIAEDCGPGAGYPAEVTAHHSLDLPLDKIQHQLTWEAS